ncbi:MAG: transporter suffix domain-containing protein [Planctomycetaceae bacterium]
MTRQSKIAVTLVIVSCAFWAGLLLVPFLGLTAAQASAFSLACIIAGEVTFWGGALIVGRDMMKGYAKYLSPRNWKRVSPIQPEVITVEETDESA